MEKQNGGLPKGEKDWGYVETFPCNTNATDRHADGQTSHNKLASSVYQVLSSKVPSYLADDIHLASKSSARSLRSSSGRKCSVTRVHSRFGDRCFAAAGQRIWNNLPASLRDKEVSYTEFRRQLKTFMFQTDCGASWLFWLLRLINTLTYLLTYLQ